MELTEEKQAPPFLPEEPRLDPKRYSVFRLDGHTFSKFVKQFKMQQPFDDNFTKAMRNTAVECFGYFKFLMGFVGSDEISYVLPPMTEEQLSKGGTL